MKNNIDSSLILNRKVIIELRFNPAPRFLDLKGTILDKINSLNIIQGADWSIGDSTLKIADNNNEELIKNIVQIGINRISLISSKVDSIEKLVSDFIKLYDSIDELLGGLIISRIGCRIQGTYKTKSTEFNKILENFKNAFPTQIFLENFPTNDLRLQIVYQNGTYHIGPVKEDDGFLMREFKNPDRNNSVGIAVDTDNYLLKTGNNDISSKTKIKDVITASLAVEKSLVENLKDF
ncbi:hypothetical protein [Tenacibaculum finnmarkense]|uniref:hypothetical protein n=1 Tax=Tenacibaculum finnmarkense TaxID=2781243 RepID=UPI001E464173|nr:hypothetical protein [Tenacibaculum finnmarkense]MCD8413606.1 hypothetical protein [Tenacibaculum finnmarkense genomovar ulcerans]